MAKIVDNPVRLHDSPVRRLHPDGGVIQPTDKQYVTSPVVAAIVRRCRAGGMSANRIAKIVGKSPEVIKKYYGDDIEDVDASLIVTISEKMAEVAQDIGHKQFVVAAKFMLSRLAPDVFAERSELQFLNAQGQAADLPGALDPYDLTDEQRESLRAALADVLKGAVDEAADHKLQRESIEVTAIEYSGDTVDYEEVEK